MAKINNIYKDEPDTFDFAKVNVLDDKTRNGNNCIVRYKSVSFCVTKENMDLFFEFIQKMNHAESF